MNSKIYLISMMLSVNILAYDLPQNIIDVKNEISKNSKIIAHSTVNLGSKFYAIKTIDNNNKVSQFAISENIDNVFAFNNSFFVHNKKNKGWESYYIPYDLEKHKEESFMELGHGKTILYAFMSPNCKYCREFYINFFNSDKLKRKYKIKFYFNLPEFSNFDRKLAFFLLNHKKPQDEYYKMAKNPNDSKYSFTRISRDNRVKFEQIIANNKRLSAIVGSLGTPSFYLEDSKPFIFNRKDLNE